MPKVVCNLTIDFDLLRRQKSELLKRRFDLLSRQADEKFGEVLDGMVNLLDAIQDAACQENGFAEDEVFDMRPVCRECGEPMVVLDNGVSHHIDLDNSVDHDRDADHTAILDGSDS